ncbi:MAG TPA: hypothetical protein VHC72_12120 [Bryobacteraceae bacterium]|nr:hypothetical protein [Bryobacteraceae bacterium]
MPTQKQIAANRRNAQKSTGPRTEHGKSISRLNARREGFTGQIIILDAEDRPHFEKFQSALVADLQPKTTLELSLAHGIAWDTWRLNHLRAVETNLYALGAENPAPTSRYQTDDPRLDPAISDAAAFLHQSAHFDRLSLYEQRLTRTLHKNLAALRDLQTERRRHESEARAEEVLLARASDINNLPYEPPAALTPNGFVFSNDQIRVAAHRASSLEVAHATLRQTAPRVQFAAARSSGPAELLAWPAAEDAA